MQIARVKVYDGRHKKFVQANVFFDTGSNKSYVSREFVEKIKPKHEGFEHVSYVSFGSKETGQSVMRNIFSLNLLCTSLSVTEIPTYL